MKQDNWTNCYDLNWKNLITPAAFSHPAKFSHGLIKRIYEHALAEGMIQPGGVVLDPFGGVGLGALYAMQSGLHWVGCELEPPFVELARENIALWNARYAAHFPGWGSAQIYQGDSRKLVEVVGAAGIVVGSPPYAEIEMGGKHGEGPNSKWRNGKIKSEDEIDRRSLGAGYGSTPGQLATLPPGTPPCSPAPLPPCIVSSPPFAGNSGGRGEASRQGIDAALFDRHSGGMIGGMGDEPGNLGNLPMGSVGAVISSPPYAKAQTGGEAIYDQLEKTHKRKLTERSRTAGYRADLQGSAPGQLGAMVVGSPPFADSIGSDDPDKRGGLFRDAKRRNDVNLTGTYGSTDGQLGGMKAGAVVGSPPYAEGLGHDAGHPRLDAIEDKRRAEEGSSRRNGYGESNGQLATDSPDTFWAAAKTIITQCYDILPPNACAIWVVKNYIKNGAEVDFTGQWQALCEACGFETVHIHRAMLVKENGAQANMFGVDKKNKVQRKSFFRLLFEAKQKSAKHWLTLNRGDQAAALWQAHNEMWRDYWIRLALFELSDEDKEKAGVKIDMAAPTRPRRNKIFHDAKAIAWVRDGKIDYEIETAINFETVLCMRKAA